MLGTKAATSQMREFLGPVNAGKVPTEMGPIDVEPGGRMVIQVHAPHLTVDGVTFQASADLSSNGEPSRFDLAQTCDSKDVGEHSAVVPNRSHFSPALANFSMLGVWHGPRNADVVPKPTSSSRISRIFGAP